MASRTKGLQGKRLKPGDKRRDTCEKGKAARGLKNQTPRKRKNQATQKRSLEEETVSRVDLLERAFQKMKGLLESNDPLSASLIGAFEKLIKIDQQLEEKGPHEIQVLWQEPNGEEEEEEQQDLP